MVFCKNDFVEIEFTGRVKNGDVFDSNVKEELGKANVKGEPKPFVFPIGNLMFVKGVDEFLIGKDVGKYEIKLLPEDAFGKRNPKMIQMVPLKNFLQNKINPIPGASFNMDGRVAKILTVSGGRVMVDFNNPVAGKDVEYSVNVLRKVDDIKEKVKAMNDFFFRRSVEFEVKNTDLILKVPKEMSQFVVMFADKYKEILGLDIKVSENETLACESVSK